MKKIILFFFIFIFHAISYAFAQEKNFDQCINIESKGRSNKDQICLKFESGEYWIEALNHRLKAPDFYSFNYMLIQTSKNRFKLRQSDNHPNYIDFNYFISPDNSWKMESVKGKSYCQNCSKNNVLTCSLKLKNLKNDELVDYINSDHFHEKFWEDKKNCITTTVR